MFKGLYPLYSRYIIKDKHNKIEIQCTQQGYVYYKIIDRILYSTNNYKIYYYNYYKGILTSKSEEKVQIKARANS